MAIEERVSLISTFRNEASPGLRVVSDDIDEVGKAAEEAERRSRNLQEALRLPSLEGSGVDAFVAQQAQLSGTTSEVIEKLIAEASELRNDAEAKADNKAALDSLLGSMDKAPESVRALEAQLKELRAEQDRSAQSSNALGNISLGQVGKFLGLAASIEGARRTVIEWTRSAVEDEAIQTRLSIAVGRHTREVEKHVDELNAQAAAISAVTGFERDAVNSGQAYAMSLGLSIEQTRLAVDAAMELSAVTGQDLQTSIQKVAWSYNGFTRELGRLVPEIKDLTKEELAAGRAAELLKEKLDGAAEGAGATTKARFSALKDELAEFGENAGRAFIDASGGAAKLNADLETTRETTKAINDNWQNIQAIFKALGAGNLLPQGIGGERPGRLTNAQMDKLLGTPGASTVNAMSSRGPDDLFDSFVNPSDMARDRERKVREFYDTFVEELPPSEALKLAKEFQAAGKGAADVAKMLQAIADSKAADEFMRQVQKQADNLLRYGDPRREGVRGSFMQGGVQPLDSFKFDQPEADPLRGRSPSDIVADELEEIDAEWQRGLNDFSTELVSTFGHTLASTRDWGDAMRAVWDRVLASLIDSAAENVGTRIGEWLGTILQAPSGGGPGTITLPGQSRLGHPSPQSSGASVGQESSIGELISEVRNMVSILGASRVSVLAMDGREVGRAVWPWVADAQARGL